MPPLTWSRGERERAGGAGEAAGGGLRRGLVERPGVRTGRLAALGVPGVLGVAARRLVAEVGALEGLAGEEGSDAPACRAERYFGSSSFLALAWADSGVPAEPGVRSVRRGVECAELDCALDRDRVGVASRCDLESSNCRSRTPCWNVVLGSAAAETRRVKNAFWACLSLGCRLRDGQPPEGTEQSASEQREAT